MKISVRACGTAESSFMTMKYGLPPTPTTKLRKSKTKRKSRERPERRLVRLRSHRKSLVYDRVYCSGVTFACPSEIGGPFG